MRRRVVEVLVERLDPLVGDVERVVHRVGRVGRVGRGLRRQVEQRLLADLPRRHLLEAQLDAGQRLELRLQRDQVLEVARRDDGDGDRLALDLLPVDLGGAVRRELVGLRDGGAASRSRARRRRRARHPAAATSRRVGWRVHGASPVLFDDMTIAAAICRRTRRPRRGRHGDDPRRDPSGAPNADVGRCRATRSGACPSERGLRHAAPQHNSALQGAQESPAMELEELNGRYQHLRTSSTPPMRRRSGTATASTASPRRWRRSSWRWLRFECERSLPKAEAAHV